MGAGVSAPLPGLDQPDRTPPKAIVTVVIDGGGWNALQAHPDSWPNIAGLMRDGTTYTNATIGSAPSITGALHANFGTGTYPVTHGIPGNQMRGPDGIELRSAATDDRSQHRGAHRALGLGLGPADTAKHFGDRRQHGDVAIGR